MNKKVYLTLLTFVLGVLILNPTTVHGAQPENLEYRDFVIMPERGREVGEVVTVLTDVKNVGDVKKDYTFEFIANGTVYDNTTMFLRGGESGTIIFDMTFYKPGEWTIGVKNVNENRLHYEETIEVSESSNFWIRLENFMRGNYYGLSVMEAWVPIFMVLIFMSFIVWWLS